LTARQRSRPPATSIWDIARAAGVSHQTVSRVINGSSRVSDTTRARVQQAIAELGFRPNRAAQALAGGPARTVTVLTADTTLYGWVSTLRGIEEAARGAGYTLGISILEPEAARSTEDVLGRLSHAGDAVAVIAFEASGVRALAALPAHYPVAAAVERPADGAAENPVRPRVWTDDRAAARDATRYLLGLGHRTVHYLAIPSSTSLVGQRTEGWLDALREAGRPVPAPVEAGWTPSSGYRAARELLEREPQTTAILCGNDDLAVGTLRAAREAGLDVPGRLSVVGFDDAPQSAFLTPALSTVRLDFVGLGRACFGLLRTLLEPDSAPAPPVCAEPLLVVRESSGPPPKPSRRQ
jgi:DNA-binding LacI/PurR family transcriptional regulator